MNNCQEENIIMCQLTQGPVWNLVEGAIAFIGTFSEWFMHTLSAIIINHNVHKQRVILLNHQKETKIV